MRYFSSKVVIQSLEWNIWFQFLPGSNDNTIVTGAGDFQVHTMDIVAKETTDVCGCATGRVKRLATAPQLPFLFWSASEDGAIRLEHYLSFIYTN